MTTRGAEEEAQDQAPQTRMNIHAARAAAGTTLTAAATTHRAEGDEAVVEAGEATRNRPTPVTTDPTTGSHVDPVAHPLTMNRLRPHKQL